MSPLQNIHVILVQTSHPGNIGATARAMKTMGLSHLRLVNPKYFPDELATAMATDKAIDVLENAMVYPDLTSALADCEMVFATSARTRYLEWPLLDVHEASKDMIKIAQSQKVAIVFGRESSGLTNEELQICQVHIRIPTNPDASSLNLAAAVQVVAYEVFRESLQGQPSVTLPEQRLATHHEIELLYDHLEKAAIELKFLDPKNPRMLMPRLRRLFSRTQLEKNEVDILRGLLTAALERR